MFMQPERTMLLLAAVVALVAVAIRTNFEVGRIISRLLILGACSGITWMILQPRPGRTFAERFWASYVVGLAVALAIRKRL